MSYVPRAPPHKTCARTDPPNQPTMFMTFVGFRVFLPPQNPLSRGALLGDQPTGLVWYERISLWLPSREDKYKLYVFENNPALTEKDGVSCGGSCGGPFGSSGELWFAFEGRRNGEGDVLLALLDSSGLAV